MEKFFHVEIGKIMWKKENDKKSFPYYFRDLFFQEITGKHACSRIYLIYSIKPGAPGKFQLMKPYFQINSINYSTCAKPSSFLGFYTQMWGTY